MRCAVAVALILGAARLVAAVRRPRAAEALRHHNEALAVSLPAEPSSNSTLLVARPQRPDPGGTACQCICGDRIVWHRELFEGDVKESKERECEHDICPYVSIPGLQVTSECTYVEDIRELTAGTVCFCQCGDKAAWVNRGFYGNVTGEKERECIEDVCPRVNPLPGLIHRAECRFNPELFRLHRKLPPLSPVDTAAKGAARKGCGAVLLLLTRLLLAVASGAEL
uniref:Uncharacterized protein n=1 Tax=Alexandrium andersonii TaxID=327968 RepID=A0A7S2BP35_9DINO|mmetsp:Transcript_27695/g.62993  ORF Transcript_27695/g.62993 Transcript_27695/m.62993 type:complete len:225 (+) Transcript_27695:186-860(+)